MRLCPADCEKRTVGCHATCETYKANKAEYMKRVEYLRGDREAKAYIDASITKNIIANCKNQQKRNRFVNKNYRK